MCRGRLKGGGGSAYAVEHGSGGFFGHVRGERERFDVGYEMISDRRVLFELVW